MFAPAHDRPRFLLCQRFLLWLQAQLGAVVGVAVLCGWLAGCAVNPVPTPEKSTDGKTNADATAGFSNDAAESSDVGAPQDASGAGADAADMPGDATGLDGTEDGTNSGDAESDGYTDDAAATD